MQRCARFLANFGNQCLGTKILFYVCHLCYLWYFLIDLPKEMRIWGSVDTRRHKNGLSIMYTIVHLMSYMACFFKFNRFISQS